VHSQLTVRDLEGSLKPAHCRAVQCTPTDLSKQREQLIWLIWHSKSSYWTHTTVAITIECHIVLHSLANKASAEKFVQDILACGVL